MTGLFSTIYNDSRNTFVLIYFPDPMTRVDIPDMPSDLKYAGKHSYCGHALYRKKKGITLKRIDIYRYPNSAFPKGFPPSSHILLDDNSISPNSRIFHADFNTVKEIAGITIDDEIDRMHEISYPVPGSSSGKKFKRYNLQHLVRLDVINHVTDQRYNFD